MSKRRKKKRRARRYQYRKDRSGLKIVAGGAAVVVLLIAGFYLLRDDPPQLAASSGDVAYDPADVVYDEGLFGVHEMGPSQTPISFLPSDGPQPKLEIPQDYWSFGQIGPRDVVDHTYVLKNTGEAPLTISRIYTTCGCTTAELTARVIPPGKSALLRLILDAGFHDVRGQQVKRGIIIENNDRKRSKTEIWVRASVGWS
jgi:hypothetical protein